MSLLSIKKLSSGYDHSIIIRDINLSVNKGEILSILGRNGVGKSTLLKTIMGLNLKNSGEIYFENKDITRFSPFEIEGLGISYASQESALFPQLTVEQNLKIGFKKTKAEFLALADLSYRYFPVLKNRLKQKAGTLSGGEKKMLLMARVMIRQPKLIVLDEITEGVQPSVIEKICEALDTMRSKYNATVLLVEQNINFAGKIGDRYVVMDQGEIKDFGEIDSNLQHKVERFIII
ncbi:MAG TPA: ABC transporter ATP-binding protein [Ureibacillus sp.]|nr:ABC transporter ATP-binding protein [Ureibacillus sp.]